MRPQTERLQQRGARVGATGTCLGCGGDGAHVDLWCEARGALVAARVQHLCTGGADLQVPARISEAAAAHWGVPLLLISDNFVEFFGRAEQMAGFTQPVNFMLSWLFNNIGLVCLFTAALQLSLATVDAKDETIAYRVLRSSSLIWMYSNGAWSKDAVVNHLTGFEDPMRLFQFFTNFGLVMWSVNTWAKVPISLK